MNCDEKCEDCDCESLEDLEFECGKMTKKQKVLFKEYLSGKKDALNKISEQLEIVESALNEAQSISDKTGVPFYSDISPLGQSYIPNSKRFSSIKNFICENEEIYDEYGEYEPGWVGSY